MAVLNSRFGQHWIAAMVLISCSPCLANQSALAPSSDTAERIWWLTVIMTAGATVIQVLVMGLVGAAIFGRWQWRRRIASVPFVFAMGVVFPIAVLTALLIYGLILMNVSPASAMASAHPVIADRIPGRAG